jgi:hypothetical protein
MVAAMKSEYLAALRWNPQFDAAPPEPHQPVPVIWRARALVDISRIVSALKMANHEASRSLVPITQRGQPARSR